VVDMPVPCGPAPDPSSDFALESPWPATVAGAGIA
jgi:hypothetical protein